MAFTCAFVSITRRGTQAQAEKAENLYVGKKSATATITSRAVRRLIEPGNNVVCAKCQETVKFLTREQAHQVIANVYEDGKWNRVEHWHEACYLDDSEPYGPAA